MSIILRDARADDLSALTMLRAPEALHRGRLRDAQSADFRYFVILHDQDLVGFVSLVFRRPASWSNTINTEHLPEINDLYITETERGRGYGSAAIHALEHIAAKSSSKELFISVEPLDNPRAFALYQRLGYRQIQANTYFHRWEALDGDGKINSGEVWLVDMVKAL